MKLHVAKQGKTCVNESQLVSSSDWMKNLRKVLIQSLSIVSAKPISFCTLK